MAMEAELFTLQTDLLRAITSKLPDFMSKLDSVEVDQTKLCERFEASEKLLTSLCKVIGNLATIVMGKAANGESLCPPETVKAYASIAKEASLLGGGKSDSVFTESETSNDLVLNSDDLALNSSASIITIEPNKKYRGKRRRRRKKQNGLGGRSSPNLPPRDGRGSHESEQSQPRVSENHPGPGRWGNHHRRNHRRASKNGWPRYDGYQPGYGGADSGYQSNGADSGYQSNGAGSGSKSGSGAGHQWGRGSQYTTVQMAQLQG